MRFILVRDTSVLNNIPIDRKRYDAIQTALEMLVRIGFYTHESQRLQRRIGDYRGEDDALGSVLMNPEEFMLLMVALNNFRLSVLEEVLGHCRKPSDVDDYICRKGWAEKMLYELRGIYKAVFSGSLLEKPA